MMLLAGGDRPGDFIGEAALCASVSHTSSGPTLNEDEASTILSGEDGLVLVLLSKHVMDEVVSKTNVGR